jgi:hypothetical protein
MQTAIKSKWNIWLILPVLLMAVGILGGIGTKFLVDIIVGLKKGNSVAGSSFFVLLLLYSFLIYSMYYFLTRFPSITISGKGIRLSTLFKSTFYPWHTIRYIELTGKQSNKFLFMSSPTEATTIVLEDERKVFLWADLYRNMPVLRTVLERANYLLARNGDLENLFDGSVNGNNRLQERDVREEGVVYSGNHLLTIHGIVGVAVLIFMVYFMGEAVARPNGSVTSILLILPIIVMMVGVTSLQMNYFVITQHYLIIKNPIRFWKRKVYAIKDIREVVVETPHRRSTSLRVIMYDFRDNLYSAGSLRFSTWKMLMHELEARQIVVRNESF